jgi:membrane-associated protease RseP (regulator of RpoE activity)
MPASGPIPSGARSELDRLRQAVASFFPVYETRLGPQSVSFAVHVDRTTLEAKFDTLRRELGALGYIPILRRDTGEDFIEVVRRPKLGARRPWINLVLLAATVATTVFAGSMIWLTYSGHLVLGPTDVLYGAIYFGLPLLAILGVHETAHYVVARRRHLDASLPYFIPIPPPYILGTFGAFVSMREPFPDRKSLFDVGAAGPIAGFAMSIPIALVGLSLSVHAPSIPATYCGPSILGQSYGNLLIGPSLFWAVLSAFFPTVVSLHPLALAGWVGILITAINLLPAGTLDGGHIFRALLGDRARYVSYAAAATLFGLGLFYIGWLLFAVLVLLLGLRHPPPLNDATPLDRKRVAVGLFVAAILVTGFVLIPLSAPTGAISLDVEKPSVLSPPPAGAAVATYLNVSVRNGDVISHGFLYTFSITNVTVNSSNRPVGLTGASLTEWEQNASWVFVSANGTRSPPVNGTEAALPGAEYVTIDGGDSALAIVEFADNESALAVGFAFSTSEFCPPAGGGSASTDVTVVF